MPRRALRGCTSSTSTRPARASAPQSTRALLRRLRAVPGLRVQLGGGIRTGAQIVAALEGDADRVMVGTLAASEPETVGRLAAETGRVVVALDCLDGRVRTHGWLEDTGAEPAAFVARLTAAGARDFLVTGIDRDGTGRGPDLELLGGLRAACARTASGGRRGGIRGGRRCRDCCRGRRRRRRPGNARRHDPVCIEIRMSV